MAAVAGMDSLAPVEADTGAPEQDQLMRALLSDVLQALTVPGDIIDEVIVASEPAPPTTGRDFGDTTLRIEVSDPNGHDYYPIIASGRAGRGMFLLRGHNSTGKTTLLITASLLLGTNWEDPEFQAFLEGEERYVETGKRFQKEMERGVRNARLEFTNDSLHVVVEVADGDLTLAIDGEQRVFRLRAKGWGPYQAHVRPLIRAQFIPQKRDYLRQVYLEVVEEVLDRMAAIEDLLLTGSGDVMVGAAQREIDELEREVERRRRDHEQAGAALEETQERLDTLQEISHIERSEADSGQRIVEHARLRRLVAEVQSHTENIGLTEAELVQVKRELEAKQRQHSLAYPALKRLLTAVKSPRQQYSSRLLREKIDHLSAQYRIGQWLDFQDEFSFAGPDLYSRLAEEVGRERRATRTFPFRDEVTDQYVSTIGEYEGVLTQHRTWSRDFDQIVREPLEQFVREVAGCADIRNEDLERLRAELTTDQRTVEASERELTDQRSALDRAIRDLASILQAPEGTDSQALGGKAQTRLNELGRSLAGWRLGPPSLDELVERLGADLDMFWAEGGAARPMEDTRAAIGKQEVLVEHLRRQLQEAEEALQRRREEVESRSQHRYARAHTIVENANAEFQRVLRLPFVEQATQQHDLMAWRQQDLMPDEVDVLEPPVDGH